MLFRSHFVTDNQIIELYFARNERAINESSNKYGRYCYSIAHKILHEARDTEECVNDTWYQAWVNIPPHRPQHLKLFFAKITRNLSFDMYRAKNRKKRGGGEIDLVLEELEECIANQQDVEGNYIAKELNESIRIFVRGLPEREANIFIRRYFYVETINEIAKRYHMSTNNVTVILSRTRNKLHEMLEMEELL